jgi:predicted PurR-regulated permease PerM
LRSRIADAAGLGAGGVRATEPDAGPASPEGAEQAADSALHEPAARREEPVPFPAPVDLRSLALTGLFLLALLYTTYAARSFLLPIVTAILFALLFAPAVRGLRNWRVPEWASAAVIVLGLIALLGYGGYKLASPAATWLARAPESFARLEERVRQFRKPVEQVTRTAERVGELTTGPADGRTLQVRVKDTSMADTLFGGTQQLVTNAFIMLALLYFLLASGDMFLAKVVKVLPSLQDKKRAVLIARETEEHVSRYLLVSTVINVAFGAAVGVAVALLGMPNAALWGVLAAATNFVPYLGGLAMTAVLALAALLQFGTLGEALLVPGVFFVLNTIEGNVVTPLVLGRRLTLNPVVVFVGVLFWGWMWGVIGMLLAVPILSTIKIVCDHVKGLDGVAEFLGP